MRAYEIKEAADLVFEYGIGSTAILQCYMNIKYAKAVGLLAKLEVLKIVGKELKDRPREVIVKTRTLLDDILDKL